jgi:hypothetical protein
MDWNAFTIVGSMMPPRDPDEEDEEDEDEEEDIGDEPAVVREPDEDQSGAPVLVVSGWKPRSNWRRSRVSHGLPRRGNPNRVQSGICSHRRSDDVTY